MTLPLLEEFVRDARTAAASDGRREALYDFLVKSMSEQSAIAAAIADQPEDEVLLHEDETCSIWSCRYDAEVVLPPHEHCMTAHLAVYRGTEVEVLFNRDETGLSHSRNVNVESGEVVTLDSDIIHAVTADGKTRSHAIHIYEGPLTRVKRSLFSWEKGDPIAFTMNNFHAMMRKRSELTEL